MPGVDPEIDPEYDEFEFVAPMGMKLNTRDWLALGNRLSHMERSCLLDLMCRCWRSHDCSLPSDLDELRELAGMSAADWCGAPGRNVMRFLMPHPESKGRLTIIWTYNQRNPTAMIT